MRTDPGLALGAEFLSPAESPSRPKRTQQTPLRPGSSPPLPPPLLGSPASPLALLEDSDDLEETLTQRTRNLKMSDMDVDDDVADEEDFVDAPEDTKDDDDDDVLETRRLLGQWPRRVGPAPFKRDAAAEWGAKAVTLGPRRVRTEPDSKDTSSSTGKSKRLSIGSPGNNGGGSSQGSDPSTPDSSSNIGESETPSEDVERLKREHQAQEETIRDQQRSIEHFHIEFEKLNSELQYEKGDKAYWFKRHGEVRDEYTRVEQEHHEFQTDFLGRDKAWKREYKAKQDQLLVELDHFRDRYHATLKAKQDLENLVLEYRQQISGLKHDISTSTRMHGQVTDDELRDRIYVLGHDLQNWIINKFRRAKIEPDREKLPEIIKDDIIAFAPSYKSMATVSKFDTINAIVSGILVYDVLKCYFFGMEENRVDTFQIVESYLNMMLNPVHINRLRGTTLALIMESNPDFINDHKNKLAAQVEDRINNILAGMTGASSPSKVRDKTLRSIIDQAVVLSQTFRVQHAQFTVEIPSTDPALPAAFDPAIMEDIKAGEEDDLMGRPILGVTFPAVFKAGDANGENLHLKNVIVKAKVLCQPPPD
ncbi:MAG: hypothetical protein M1837_003533 [Sclerophora amabilis]|nr:MAG: hypothetical protein M1837_003533 [Sclerophora amabilis]